MPNRELLQFDAKQIQAKFKHVADFGIAGEYNKMSATEYEHGGLGGG